MVVKSNIVYFLGFILYYIVSNFSSYIYISHTQHESNVFILLKRDEKHFDLTKADFYSGQIIACGRFFKFNLCLAEPTFIISEIVIFLASYLCVPRLSSVLIFNVGQ